MLNEIPPQLAHPFGQQHQLLCIAFTHGNHHAPALGELRLQGFGTCVGEHVTIIASKGAYSAHPFTHRQFHLDILISQRI